MPACSQNAAVGPLSTSPPTKGLTATTGAEVATSASCIPGSARIGPMEITGFEGPITTASAEAIASSTSGVGPDGRHGGQVHVLDRPLARG